MYCGEEKGEGGGGDGGHVNVHYGKRRGGGGEKRSPLRGKEGGGPKKPWFFDYLYHFIFEPMHAALLSLSFTRTYGVCVCVEKVRLPSDPVIVEYKIAYPTDNLHTGNNDFLFFLNLRGRSPVEVFIHRPTHVPR